MLPGRQQKGWKEVTDSCDYVRVSHLPAPTSFSLLSQPDVLSFLRWPFSGGSENPCGLMGPGHALFQSRFSWFFQFFMAACMPAKNTLLRPWHSLLSTWLQKIKFLYPRKWTITVEEWSGIVHPDSLASTRPSERLEPFGLRDGGRERTFPLVLFHLLESVSAHQRETETEREGTAESTLAPWAMVMLQFLLVCPSVLGISGTCA